MFRCQTGRMATRPMLLFDGDCGFCTTTARWGERRWPDAAQVVPWQHTDIEALGLTPEQCNRELQWVGADGRHASGAAAVGRWLHAAGGVWKLLGWLAYTPPTSWIASGIYRLVAANRSRLPGGTPACQLRPPPSSNDTQAPSA
jgi:predicted DCC family thiol-disulfide oxidoreductase YuxK